VCGHKPYHLGWTTTHADYKWFAIAGVPCFEDTFVQGGSSVSRMKFSAKNPRHRNLRKRCTQYLTNLPND